MIIIENHKKELEKLDTAIRRVETLSCLSSTLGEGELKNSVLSSMLNKDNLRKYSASLHHAKASLYLAKEQYEEAAEEENKAIEIIKGEKAKYYYQLAWIRHLSKFTDTVSIKAGLNAPDGEEELPHFCEELREMSIFWTTDIEAQNKVATFLNFVEQILQEQNRQYRTVRCHLRRRERKHSPGRPYKNLIISVLTKKPSYPFLCATNVDFQKNIWYHVYT